MTSDVYGNAMDFQMELQMPSGVSGDRCLLQRW